MNVKQLKEMLFYVNDDTLVVLSKDGEGNGFSPLATALEGYMYEAETTWMGEIWKPGEDPEEYYQGDEETSVPCVVLWPVN